MKTDYKILQILPSLRQTFRRLTGEFVSFYF